MIQRSKLNAACCRAIAALVLGVFPTAARATGSGLEYVIFAGTGLIPAVLILLGLMFYVAKSDLTNGQRWTLVWTYVVTAAIACAAIFSVEQLPFLFSPLVWIGPLIIGFLRHSMFFADDGR